ncbi:MAG: metal ABC transporter permease [Clostridia bacterium]|nr:metal ABC transporter permease [Clostridia bacterium]
MFIEFLSYPFVQRAILVGSLVAVCAALLGVSLVLKRYSMIGDGLSHVGFAAMSIGVAFNKAPLFVAIPVVIIAAFLLLRLSENGKIKGDAAIAMISSSSIAVAMIVVSLQGGMNTDIYDFMFGSILAVNKSEVIAAIVMAAVIIPLYIICYNKIFSITFDEAFSKATGIKTNFYNTLLALLTAVTVVVGMRLIGTLLISSLIIFPCLTAMRVFKSYKKVVICSAILAILGVVIGISASCVLSIPAGSSIVVTNLLMFIIFTIIGKIK